MNKKTLGIILTALIIGTMIVLMVKSNIDKLDPIENLVGPDSNLLDENIGFQPGDTPPDFELSTLSGELVKLSDYKGKKVILNFWASWCGPCKAEMPHMEKYYKENKDAENVEIIAVNLTKQERKGLKGIKEFIDAYGLTFPVPLDEGGRVMDAYGVIVVPTTYLIHTDGTISQKIVRPIHEKMMKDFVDTLN